MGTLRFVLGIALLCCYIATAYAGIDEDLVNAIDYLVVNQSADGSWDNDDYKTAVVMFALRSLFEWDYAGDDHPKRSAAVQKAFEHGAIYMAKRPASIYKVWTSFSCLDQWGLDKCHKEFGFEWDDFKRLTTEVTQDGLILGGEQKIEVKTVREHYLVNLIVLQQGHRFGDAVDYSRVTGKLSFCEEQDDRKTLYWLKKHFSFIKLWCELGRSTFYRSSITDFWQSTPEQKQSIESVGLFIATYYSHHMRPTKSLYSGYFYHCYYQLHSRNKKQKKVAEDVECLDLDVGL